MIVDASAAIAVFFNEPEEDAFMTAIASAKRRSMSAVSYFECGLVLDSERGEATSSELETWLDAAGIEIVPFTRDQARTAMAAFRTFGKGRHRARLNLGDCASYALAMIEDQALLYKGGDFALTDVRSAL